MRSTIKYYDSFWPLAKPKEVNITQIPIANVAIKYTDQMFYEGPSLLVLDIGIYN
jgi:hypothetical protein